MLSTRSVVGLPGICGRKPPPGGGARAGARGAAGDSGFCRYRTLGEAVPELEELKVLARRGPVERKQYLDALEDTYGEDLKAGNARARRLLAELTKTHGAWP